MLSSVLAIEFFPSLEYGDTVASRLSINVWSKNSCIVLVLPSADESYVYLKRMWMWVVRP